MKKVFSIILAVCIFAVSGIFGAGAYTLPQGYAVSVGEGDSFDSVSGTVIGYVGDADESLAVNVKDATAIQKHIASILTLSDNGTIVADVDFSENVNIKDATAIQKWVAGMWIDSPVYHVLYTGEVGETESIVGVWTYSKDISPALDDVFDMLGYPMLSEDINIDSLVVSGTCTFNDDGTYVIAFDEDYTKETIDTLKVELEDDMADIIEAIAAENGLNLTADQLLFFMGYSSMSEFMNDMFTEDMINEMLAPVEGTYRTENGKLYMDEENPDYYETYTLTEDTLTLTGNNANEIPEMYPLVMTRIS